MLILSYGKEVNMNFKAIFERHFFSNHHVEAKRIESRLEDFLPGPCECISYSSLTGLIVATLDELCEDNTVVHVKCDDLNHKSLNAFLEATGRKKVAIWNLELQTCIETITKVEPTCDLSKYILGALMRGREITGLLLDFAESTDLLESAPIFVTWDRVLAEKIRWSRSSYGRRTSASVKIAANGRFSEFQGAILNSILNENGFG